MRFLRQAKKMLHWLSIAMVILSWASVTTSHRVRCLQSCKSNTASSGGDWRLSKVTFWPTNCTSCELRNSFHAGSQTLSWLDLGRNLVFLFKLDEVICWWCICLQPNTWPSLSVMSNLGLRHSEHLNTWHYCTLWRQRSQRPFCLVLLLLHQPQSFPKLSQRGGFCTNPATGSLGHLPSSQ